MKKKGKKKGEATRKAKPKAKTRNVKKAKKKPGSGRRVGKSKPKAKKVMKKAKPKKAKRVLKAKAKKPGVGKKKKAAKPERLAAKPPKPRKIVKAEPELPVQEAHAMPRAGEKVEMKKPRGTGELREIRLQEQKGKIRVTLYSEFGVLREDVIDKDWVGEEIRLILSSAMRTMKPGDEIFVSGLDQEDLRIIVGSHIRLSTDSEMFVEEYEKDGRMGLRIFFGPGEDVLPHPIY